MTAAAELAGEEAIRDHQLRRLREGLPAVLRTNPFYRGRLRSVRRWGDFERLPFTTKADLAEDQRSHPPFGTDLTFPLERYVRLHQTSGTSGAEPLRWLDTAESWDWWSRIWAEHVYASAGLTAADRVFFAFSFGPFIGFWSAYAGAARVGAMAIPGGAMSTAQRVHAIHQTGATALCCTPTYALRLAEAAAELGQDLAGSSLRLSVHAGEPGASIPATRAAIEAGLGVRAFDHTGMTELGPTGVSCPQRDGVHLIESEFIFEVVEGELVATNLGRWGSPLVRYRTGDRVQVARAPCSCGSPFLKVTGGLAGRVDDMFTVRGVNVFPSQVEDILRRRPEVGEFVIECRRIRQMDEATVLLEVAGGTDGEVLRATVAAELRAALGVRLEVGVAVPGSLPRSELKARRLVRIP
ncbi:MAG: phenylacetate--CoA ligase family protein [Candidatus Dormibacterales bacterium]